MLIKQVTDVKYPRHAFLDDAQPVPSVSVELETRKARQILVAPATVAVVMESLPAKPVGSIKVVYDRPEPKEEDEYDETEELYSAAAAHVVCPDVDIAILAVGETLVVTVPRFANVMVYHLVAKALVKAVDAETWLYLATSSMGVPVSILYDDSMSAPPSLAHIPYLRPPHVVTGISAALMTKKKGFCVVLSSEGQPGFERVDADALVDAAVVVGEIVGVSGYEKVVSGKVRRFTGVSHQGMYL